MTVIEDVLIFWVNLGLLDIILPFILIFTVLFGVLQKTEVLGKDKSRINSMVAFTIAFISIAVANITQVITKFAQYSALAIIGFIMLTLILSFMGAKSLGKSKFLLWSAFLTILLIAISALGWWKYIDASFINSTLLMPLVMLIFFFFAIWFITRGEGETVTDAVKDITQPSKPEKRPRKELDEEPDDEGPKKSKSRDKKTGPKPQSKTKHRGPGELTAKDFEDFKREETLWEG